MGYMDEETMETWFKVEEETRISPWLLTEWMNNGSQLYVIPDFSYIATEYYSYCIESCLLCTSVKWYVDHDALLPTPYNVIDR